MGVYPIGVAGESFRNADGSDRQAEIARCRALEPVSLEREPDNPYDANCIRVVSVRGIQIGNLPRAAAAWLAERIDRGQLPLARIHRIARGGADARTLGVILCVSTETALPDESFEFDYDAGGGFDE